jgi:hypothetical protein
MLKFKYTILLFITIILKCDINGLKAKNIQYKLSEATEHV